MKPHSFPTYFIVYFNFPPPYKNHNSFPKSTTTIPFPDITMSPSFLLFTILSFLSIAIVVVKAQDRLHGLPHQPPIALSPQAFAFFHPNALQPTTSNPCQSKDCSSLPLASSTVKSTPASESASAHRTGLGPAAIVGIPLGFILICFITAGLYFVVIKRPANLRKPNLVKPAEP